MSIKTLNERWAEIEAASEHLDKLLKENLELINRTKPINEANNAAKRE